jgi:hypothetical protein
LRSKILVLLDELLDNWDDFVWSEDSQEHGLTNEGHSGEWCWPVGLLALWLLEIVNSLPFIDVLLEIGVEAVEWLVFSSELQN